MSSYIYSIVVGFLAVFLIYFQLGLFIANLFLSVRQTLLKIVLSFYIGFSLVSSTYFFYGNLFGLSTRPLDFVFLIIGILLLPHTFLYFQKTQLIQKVGRTFRTHSKSSSRLRFFSVFCALTLYITVSLSGFPIGDKRYIQSGLDHDSYWHIALINNLTESMPPTHPSSYLEVLSNYHYFYDILFIPIVRTFSADVFALYFQVFPLLLALLLSFSASLLAERILKNQRYLLVFFVFFGGSFAYLLPLFLPGIQWGESSFWVSQTFATMINPQAIYTFGLLYLVIALLFEHMKEKSTENRGLLMVIFLLIASSMGFKSYSFLVLSALLISYLSHHFFLARNIKKTAADIGLFLLLSVPYFFLVVGFGGASSFIYAPLWFLSSMIESRDRIYYPEFKLREEHYLLHKNYLRIVEIKLKEFFIFVVGNLGTRIILIALFLKRKTLHELKANTLLFSIFIAFIFSCTLPLIFLQKGIVWNTIQFWYYGLILGNVLVSIAIAKTVMKIEQKVVQKILIAILIAATIPTFVVTTWSRVTHFYTVNLETEAWLQRSLPAGDRVLICPSKDVMFDTSFVKMYAKADILLADTVQLTLVSSPVHEQEEVLINSFRTSNIQKITELISHYKITKILCSDSNNFSMINEISEGAINKIENIYVKEI